jgi:hypothetical protein
MIRGRRSNSTFRGRHCEHLVFIVEYPDNWVLASLTEDLEGMIAERGLIWIR